MSPPTNNPVAYTYTDPNATNTGSTASSIAHPPPISKAIHIIAGIETTVYGLAELPTTATEISALWLLHPRLQTQSCMSPFAAHFITSWNNHQKSKPSSSSKGLIAISFDQRNHGTREIKAQTNGSWREGNETHAQDMFSCYHGTASDTSLLLDYLAAYIFPENNQHIIQNIVMGVSLGGHAAWQVLMHDHRFSAAIVTIGCPDYERLMSDRARLSKRESWMTDKGRRFIGSKDYPAGLRDCVGKYDPAGLLFGLLDESKRKTGGHLDGKLSEDEKTRIMPVMARTLGNKRVLNLAGGADKLVPYAVGKPFLDWVKMAIGKGGWFEGGGLVLQDVVVPGAGHEVPPDMVRYMERFLIESLESEGDINVVGSGGKKERRDSRI